METMNGKPVLELLCAPLPEGQAVLELRLRQRILSEKDLYRRKRRLRHTFFVRAGDRIAKFEVAARVWLLPARISVAEVQKIAVESVREEIEASAREVVREQVAETDPSFPARVEKTVAHCLGDGRFEERVARVAQRLIDTYGRDGVVIE